MQFDLSDEGSQRSGAIALEVLSLGPEGGGCQNRSPHLEA